MERITSKLTLNVLKMDALERQVARPLARIRLYYQTVME